MRKRLGWCKVVKKSFVVFTLLCFCFAFTLPKETMKKIRKWTNRTNKGYLYEFNKIFDEIKKEPQLKIRLKVYKWLYKKLKGDFLKNYVKEKMLQEVQGLLLKAFEKSDYSLPLCHFDTDISFYLTDLYYDTTYNKIFLVVSDNILPKKCKENVYLVNTIYGKVLDRFGNIKAMVYRVGNVIYVYRAGEFIKTDYSDVVTVAGKEVDFPFGVSYGGEVGSDFSKLGFIFKKQNKLGVYVDGAEYQLKAKKCYTLHLSVNSSGWAAICNSKKYKNGVVIIFNGRKMKGIYHGFTNITLYGKSIAYIGILTSPFFYLHAVFIDGRRFKWYVSLRGNFNPRFYINPYLGKFIPLKKDGSRWIYVAQVGQTILFDTANIIKPTVIYPFSAYLCAVSLLNNNDLYYLGWQSYNKKGERIALFRNHRPLFKFPKNARNFGCKVPQSKEYLILNYFNPMKKYTKVFVLNNKRFRIYKVRRFSNLSYRQLDGDTIILRLYDELGTTKKCAILKNFSLTFFSYSHSGFLRRGECNFIKYRNNFLEVVPDVQQNRVILVDAKRKKVIHFRHPDFYAELAFYRKKNVLLLLSSTYSNEVDMMIYVSKNLGLKVGFERKRFYFSEKWDSFFYLGRDNILRKIKISQLLTEWFFKIAKLCVLQKKLCNVYE